MYTNELFFHEKVLKENNESPELNNAEK